MDECCLSIGRVNMETNDQSASRITAEQVLMLCIPLALANLKTIRRFFIIYIPGFMYIYWFSTKCYWNIKINGEIYLKNSNFTLFINSAAVETRHVISTRFDFKQIDNWQLVQWDLWDMDTSEPGQLTLTMLRVHSPKAQKRKNLWKTSKPCHVGTHWKALAEYFHMSTHLPGFRSFFRFFASFYIGQISHQQHKG